MSKQWSGERLETHIKGETMQEHLHRYAVAADLAKGRTVLDIACGEGYGASLLAKVAAKVMAVDIDGATIQKAAEKYKAENLDFLTGSLLQIPFPDRSFDMITCFETIEHITEHEQALSELKRVLKPGGILMISTPDRVNYSEIREYKNLFHRKELDGEELKSLIRKFFSSSVFYKQQSVSGSQLIKENETAITIFYKGNYTKLDTSKAPVTMYWLAIATDQPGEWPGSSFFQSAMTEDEIREDQTHLIKQTATYRFGHLILSPFKWIRSLFRK